MAQKKKDSRKTKTQDKWKKKISYSLLAPSDFDNKELGITYAEKPELVMGRTINVSLRDLTNQAKKNHITLKFKVSDVKGSKAYTDIFGHEIKESYLKRFAQRRTSKVRLIQDVTTKDKKKIRVSTITVTSRKASSDQRTAIRKIMEEEIKYFAKSTNYNNLVSEFIFGSVASKIFNSAKKITPLKRVEIAKSKVLPK